MSEADKIFEELNFCKVIDENHIYYNNLNASCTIEFDLVKKVIRVYDTENEEFGFGIELDELQAINKKCRELGWFKNE